MTRRCQGDKYNMREFINIVTEGFAGTFYHGTERVNTPDILSNGFIGGWGDAGFGVYLFDNPFDAQQYAAKGGWDGELEQPVILKIQADDVERVPVLSSEWDAQLYENMWWHDMEDQQDEDDPRWIPLTIAAAD